MKSFLLLSASLAGALSFSPSEVQYRSSNEVALRNTNLERSTSRPNLHQLRIAERLYGLRKDESSDEHVGTFGLDGTIDPGVILAVSVGTTLPGGVTSTAAISASCESCYTTGTGVVTTSGVDFDESIFDDPFKLAEELFTDPTGLIQSAFDIELDFSLSNFSGHFDFDVTFSGIGSYVVSVPIPNTPVGGTFPNPPLPDPAPTTTIGLIPTIDIIFSVTGGASVLTGFEFAFPEDASFKVDAINGEIMSTNFGDVQFNPLPVEFKSGAGTFSASLRLGAKLAFDFHAVGQGFSLETGAYSDVPTYAAAITYDPNEECQLAFTENLAIDVGVFATAVAQIDFVNFGVGPKFVTTLASLPLPGTCIASSTSVDPLTTVADLGAAATDVVVRAIAEGDSLSVTSVQPGLTSPGLPPVTIASAFVATSLESPVVGPFIVATTVSEASALVVVQPTPESVSPADIILGLIAHQNDTTSLSGRPTGSVNGTITTGASIPPQTPAPTTPSTPVGPTEPGSTSIISSNDSASTMPLFLHPLSLLAITSLMFIVFA